ncbi:MAG: protein kinase [Rickettsiales bacterium]|nr:protein kinase [Rickettsiales bacterium]
MSDSAGAELEEELEDLRKAKLGETKLFSSITLNGGLLRFGEKDVERIGDGSSGEVFKVYSGDPGERGSYFILKEQRYRPIPGVDDGESEYFEEYQKSPFNSASLLKIHHITASKRFSILEYCEQGDLWSLDRSDAREICEDPYELGRFVDGIDELHKRGYVHRDIKPANIFLKKKGKNKTLVIGDLGTIKKCENDYMGFVNVGSPCYASPEFIGGSEMSDLRKADVYSIGMTFFEILALKKEEKLVDVFSAKYGYFGVYISTIAREDPDKFREIISGKLDEVVPPLKASLKELVERATDPDLNKRPSVEELKIMVEKIKMEKQKEAEKEKEKRNDTVISREKNGETGTNKKTASAAPAVSSFLNAFGKGATTATKLSMAKKSLATGQTYANSGGKARKEAQNRENSSLEVLVKGTKMATEATTIEPAPPASSATNTLALSKKGNLPSSLLG